MNEIQTNESKVKSNYDIKNIVEDLTKKTPEQINEINQAWDAMKRLITFVNGKYDKILTKTSEERNSLIDYDFDMRKDIDFWSVPNTSWKLHEEADNIAYTITSMASRNAISKFRTLNTQTWFKDNKVLECLDYKN